MRTIWRLITRTIRAVRLLARDGRIPRPLRWLAAIGLLPIPGPVDEAILFLVALPLFIFYRQPMSEAWRRAEHPEFPLSSSRVSLLPDYSRQAERYDDTRSASPSVLRPLRVALAGAPGRRLADIGGGTGNYALALQRDGWDPVVADRSAEMLARAAAKGLEVIEADAQQLPFEDESFDAAMMISMLHHVEDRGAALAEARRILRVGGRLVLKGFTGEDAASIWILDYFPSSRPWMEATHPPRAAILEELPGARLLDFEFEDMEDASLAALSADPERVLAAGENGATSFFERMQRDHPDELRAGLARLREDIAAGRAPCRAGTATVLSWTKR